MKKLFLITLLITQFSVLALAQYPKEQLVLIQDMMTSGVDLWEDNYTFAWRADSVSKTNPYSKDIFYFDGSRAIQITNNGKKKEIIDFRNGEILFTDKSDGDDEIYLYKDGNIINLSNNDQYDGYAQRYEDRICWMSGTELSSTDNEVYLYENGTVKRITDNNYREVLPLMNKDYLVWNAQGGSDVENIFFIYKDGEITELHVDILDYYFTLNDDYLIWRSCDGGENCTEGMGYPSGLDHEIFIYNFKDKTITQVTDTPDKRECSVKASNNLISWIIQIDRDPAKGIPISFELGAYDFNEIKNFDLSDKFGSLYANSVNIKDDKFTFTDEVNDVFTLFLYENGEFKNIISGSFGYGFCFGGLGYCFEEDAKVKTYLYKDGKSELIFDAFDSGPQFFDSTLAFGYRYPGYPDTKVYKLVYLDIELPYFILDSDSPSRLREGDQLNMSLTIKNPGEERVVDVYIAEVFGEYPFCEILFLSPTGFQPQLYGFKNITLPKDLDLTFELYSYKIGEISESPLNKVRFMVIPTNPGTITPLTAFPSELNFELIK